MYNFDFNFNKDKKNEKKSKKAYSNIIKINNSEDNNYYYSRDSNDNGAENFVL